jgi:iron complex outermembrane recepter protein
MLGVVTVLAGTAWGTPTPTVAGGATRAFDIPAATAESTLRIFAEQADTQFVYSADKVEGVRTNALKGNYAPREALAHLVSGTELFVVQDERTGALAVDRIRPPAIPPPPPANQDDKKMKPHKTLLGLLASLFVAIAPAPLDAQTAPPDSSSKSPATTEETIALPQFTVSSERDASYTGKQALSTSRVAIDLPDIAQSITVLNKSFIDNASPTILSKSLLYVGGAQTGTITWSVDRYMIRGFVGEGDFVDGFLTSTDKNTDLNLVDHVEIIKGPAAIFVANQASTVGGVINKISKTPTDYDVGSVSLQIGMWDANRADLDIGGPVAPGSKLSYRLLVARQDSKGYFDYQYENRSSILPMLAYRFSKDTEAWVKFETFDSHYSSYNGLPLDGRTGQMMDVPRTWNISGNTPQVWRTDSFYRLWGQFTTRPADWVNIRLAAFDSKDDQRKVEAIFNATNNTTQTVVNPATGATITVTGIPGYVIPASYTPGTLLTRNLTAVDGIHYGRREVQNDYAFNFDTGPISHKLLVGADALDYPQRTRFFDKSGNNAIINKLDPFNYASLTSSANLVGVNFNQTPSQVLDVAQTFAKIYALDTASFLNNRVIANFGVSRSRFASSQTAVNFNQTTGATSTSFAPDQELYKNLVQFGLVVKPVKDVSLFYGENSNFAATGFNGANVLNPASQGKQKEAGIKSVWFEDRLSVNISYFNVVQFNNTVPSFPQDGTFVLVGGETSRGFDGDYSYKLNKNFAVFGSFATFKAHIALAAPWNLIVQPYDGRVHKDLPVNNVAQHTASMWGRYLFTEEKLKGLSLGLGVNYMSKRAIDDNSGSDVCFGFLPARTLVDASLTYETKRLTYQVNVDNLLNTKYVFAARSSSVLVPGTPLNARFSITYRFR